MSVTSESKRAPDVRLAWVRRLPSAFPRCPSLPLPPLRQDLSHVGPQEDAHRLSLQKPAAEETQVRPKNQQSQSVQEQPTSARHPPAGAHPHHRLRSERASRFSVFRLPWSGPFLTPRWRFSTGLIPSQNPRLAFQQYLEGSDRPYKCQFCSKAYKKSSHLKQHVRSGRPSPRGGRSFQPGRKGGGHQRGGAYKLQR